MNEPISLLIPTMNRPETLQNTLDHFFSSKVIPNQLVVIDQSEKTEVANEICDMVKEYAHKYHIESTYVHQGEPSLTKARNNALTYAKYDLIVMSDDDVEVYDDTLFNVNQLMSDKDIAMIGGIDDNSMKSKSCIGYVIGTKSYSKKSIGHVTKSVLGRYPQEIKGIVETEWAMGYFFVVRRNLLMEWNINWDEKLTSYAYAEDLDFSYRYYLQAKADNKKCVLSENVRLKHLVSKEYRIPSKKDTNMYIQNRLYLSAKWGDGHSSSMLIRWTNLCMLMLRIIKRENPLDFFKAIIYAENNRDKIKHGCFKY